ncbi:MAG: hypothetical protein RIR49_20 [Actinomycetota bacterium]
MHVSATLRTLSFEEVVSIDVHGLDAAAISVMAGRIREFQGRLSAFESALRSRAHELSRPPAPADPVGVDPPDGPQPVNPTLIDAVLGVSSAEARRRDRRREVLERIPSLGAHLEAGRITPDHLDAISAVALGAPDELRGPYWASADEITRSCLAGPAVSIRRALEAIVTRLAVQAGIDRTRRRRDRTRLGHRMDPASGMGRIWGELDPDLYHRFSSVLDAAVRSQVAAGVAHPNLDWLTAHTLVDLLEGRISSPSAGGATISVIIDDRTLRHGLHENSVCEYVDGTAIDVATVRQMACSAAILPVVLSGRSLPLDVGRGRRLATTEQRHALAAVYATCAVDRCGVPFDDCHVHHLDPWEDGGATDLANLVPVCSHHHTRLHQEGWELSLDAERTLSIVLPDGSRSVTVPDRLPQRRRIGDDGDHGASNGPVAA